MPEKSKASDGSLSKSKESAENVAKREKNLKKKWLSYILNVVIVLAASAFLYLYESDINKPLTYPRIYSRYTVSEDALSKHQWGTYRPGVYFGVGSRMTKGTFFDLMWFTHRDGKTPDVRYQCDEGDNLNSYAWTEHDGYQFGNQVIRDGNLNITTQFLRRNSENGSAWSIRVRGESYDTSQLYSFILLNFGGYVGGRTSVNISHSTQQFCIHGKMLKSVPFQFYSSISQAPKGIKFNYLFSSLFQPSSIKETVSNNLKKRKGDKTYTLPTQNFTASHRLDKAGLMAFQYTTQTPFEIDFHFEPSRLPNDEIPSGDFQELTQEINTQSDQFHSKFETVFSLGSKGYSPEQIAFGQAALSCLLGGIGFFYGRSWVAAPHHGHGYIDYLPGHLLTGTPARAKFPRGFLWDEGFHLLLVVQWSPPLAMQVLGHWLDMMNADGWIPREQVLGEEARSRIPPEFIVQHSDIANPPTFFLVLESLLKLRSQGKLDSSLFIAFLEKAYPRLRAWFEWYLRTQAGEVENTFRWKGRDPRIDTELNPKTLASGLDDSPRASHPSDSERHIDLLCWMSLAAKVLRQIADLVGDSTGASSYRGLYSKFGSHSHMVKYHWDSAQKHFSDYGLHSDDVTLQSRVQQAPRRRVGIPPKQQLVSHFGYINLFPLLLRQLPANSDQLGSVLASLDDPKRLWSDFGLRSLSASDPVYRKHNTPTDGPYWRGAVWINLNFLAVHALHHYSGVEGPHRDRARDLYARLRENLVSNVFEQFQETGYFWEQYDDRSGKGMGAHPFNGWTSLVLLMMAEIY